MKFSTKNTFAYLILAIQFQANCSIIKFSGLSLIKKLKPTVINNASASHNANDIASLNTRSTEKILKSSSFASGLTAAAVGALTLEPITFSSGLAIASISGLMLFKNRRLEKIEREISLTKQIAEKNLIISTKSADEVAVINRKINLLGNIILQKSSLDQIRYKTLLIKIDKSRNFHKNYRKSHENLERTITRIEAKIDAILKKI